MVLASNPVASVMRLAARPVGAQRSSFTPLAESTRRMDLTMVVLPTPGPPVMTSTLERQRQADRRLLAVGKLQAAALLDPGQGLVRIDPGPGELAVDEPQQPLGDGPLGPIETCQEHARRFADAVGDDRCHRRVPDRAAVRISSCGTSSKLLGERHQLVGGQSAMALVHGLGQGKGDAGAHPDHGGLLDAELHRRSRRRS